MDKVDEQENPLIIQAIISRLASHEYPDVRKNLKVALTNIVAGVLDHNERVQDTVDAKKHVQHEKMPLLPPPPTPMDQMKSQGLPTKFR